MLALMSSCSIYKDNPKGEWQLGVALGKERRVDFLIPLRVDAFPQADLGFIHINRQYLDFSRSWADGLRALLITLDDVLAPNMVNDQTMLKFYV